jgi:hypothetical protein
LLLGGAIAACDTPRPARPQLWTIFDVQALYAQGASPDKRIATDAGLPGGVALGSMLGEDHTTLTVQPAWAEAYPAGYLTTEVWAHFDEVWAQPLYFPVSGWSGGAPQDISQHPIFSVGAGSLFYSPFWQMIYVQVPEGTATSARDIIDGRYALHPARGWAAALIPDGVGLAAPSAGAVPGTGWLDGSERPFLKFPKAPVSIGADAVVAEVPIFHFVFVREDGSWAAPAIPAVLGTGPLYSNTPPSIDLNDVPTGVYSAYWRVYDVVVPAGARVFAPPGSPYDQTLQAEGVKNEGPTAYGTDITAAPDKSVLADIYGRVSLDDRCFATLAGAQPRFGDCSYLDSQKHIEDHVAKIAIIPTDVTVTCPVVTVNNMPVQP